jgi:hypothetical protein
MDPPLTVWRNNPTLKQGFDIFRLDRRPQTRVLDRCGSQ